VLAPLDTSDGIALGAGIVAALALGVAVSSVFVARRANKLSKESNTIAGGSKALSKESNEIAREAVSHRARGVELAESAEVERQRRASARAVMRAEMVPLMFVADGNSGTFRPLVRVRNVGRSGQRANEVRVYMVAGHDLMSWDDEWTRHDRVRPVTDPDVTFHHPVTQADLPAQFIERTFENITTTMPVEVRVVVPMDIPGPGQARNHLPLRIVVRADNADEPFVWTDYMQTEYGRHVVATPRD
jgi:hypothetical protein